MVRKYRPTTLRIYAENCPAALGYFLEAEAGASHCSDRTDSYTRAEREIEGNEAAEVGIAFHACMHMAAEAAIKGKNIQTAIEATAIALTGKMDPYRARAGADMALVFCEHWECDTRMKYEHGLAFDKSWKSVDWEAEDRRLRMVLDVYGCVDETDEQGEVSKVAISEDFKTGWGATSDIIDSIQMKAHSSALFAIHGNEADFIEVRVNATRFKKVFSKRWDMKLEGDVDDLKKRQKDVEFFMNAADQSNLEPRIGPGCILCDYSRQCPAFQGRLAAIKSGDVVNIAADPRAAAIDFAIVQAESKRLQAGLKEAAKNSGGFDFGDMVLGFHTSEKRTIKDPKELVEFWFSKARGAMDNAEEAKRTTRALVAAMKPGTTQLDNIFKAVARAIGYKSQKACIEELSPQFCNMEQQSKFQWKKKAQLDGVPEENEE